MNLIFGNKPNANFICGTVCSKNISYGFLNGAICYYCKYYRLCRKINKCTAYNL